MSNDSRGLAFDMCTKVIVAALENKDWNSLTDKGITEKHFSANCHARNAFKRIQKYHDQNGTLPSTSYISKAVPGFGRLVDSVELEDDNVAFLASSLVRLNVIDKVMAIGNSIEDQLDSIDNLDYPTEEETMNLIATIMEASMSLAEATIEDDDILLNESFAEGSKPLENLKKLVKGEIERGVLTGIEPLDFITNGLSPSDFWTFIAFTNVGKSMIMCILALSLAYRGYKVLFLTKEMQAVELWKRIVALHHKIRLGKMYSGDLSEEELEAIENTDTKKMDVILSGVYGGVADIFAKVDKYTPDVIIVDSAYLFADNADDSKQGWEKVAGVWRSLKQYCGMKGIPVIATTQSNTEKVTLSSISYVKQLRADCTVIFGVEEDTEEGRTNQIQIRTLKNRSGGKGGTFNMNWDFYEMDWDVVNWEIVGYEEYLMEKKAKEQKKAMEESRKSKKSKLLRSKKQHSMQHDNDSCHEPSAKGKELLSLFRRGGV